MSEFDFDEEVILDEDEEIKHEEPPMYRVLFHNDDYTTMEFVIYVLETIFHKSSIESLRIMLEVHHYGIAEVGIYTYEVASTNIYLVEQLAEANECPFRASMEKIV